MRRISLELRPAAPERHHVGLQPADAVLGRKAAVEVAHHGGDGVHDGVVQGEEGRRVHALGLHQVEMDVAVAEMAERGRPDAGQQGPAGRGGAADQLGHPRRPARRRRS